MDANQAREILTLRPDQHGLILGMTGTGKSTLARVMLQFTSYNQLVLIDPKGDFRLPKGLTFSSKRGRQYIILVTLPEDAIRYIERGYNVLWRPHPEHMTREDIDAVLCAVYWSPHGPVRLYIDELALLMTAQVFPLYFAAILQSGRGREVTALLVSQRPSGIPVVAKSESTKSYVFRLRMLRDRQTVAEWMEYDIRDVETRDAHGFWYREETDLEPRYCVIEFTG